MRIAVALAALLAVAAPAAARAQAEKVAKLGAALKTERSEKVRVQAAVLLGKAGGPEAAKFLEVAIETDDSMVVRLACAGALGAIGDPSARPVLEGVFKSDPAPDVREAAKAALARLDAAGVLSAARPIAVENATGSAGNDAVKLAFSASLTRNLGAKGFKTLEADKPGALYRIKPSVTQVSVSSGEGKTTIAVKATVVATDSDLRVVALLENGARVTVKAENLAPEMEAKATAAAFDAVAKTLAEDLVSKLR